MPTDAFKMTGAVRTTGVAVLALLALFLGALTINEVREWGTTEPAQRTISIDGMGEVFAVPDIATFSFSVIVEADTASAAQAEAAETANAALEYLSENGVEEKDIKTIGYNVYPRYEYTQQTCPVGVPCPTGERRLVGYEINQTFEVKVRDTERAGELLSGVGETGVSNISGLSFTIDEPSELQAEARQKAIADAREKAEVLAEQLGVRLKDVVSFHESSDGGYPKYVTYDSALGRGGAEQSAPSLPEGENKITSRVNVTFEIR